MGGQKTADFSHMNPGQQIRIAGGVRTAISSVANHLQVNGADFFDQPVSVASGTEGGAGDELAGAAQTAEQVLAKVGVVPDPGQGQGMQQLQKQGTDTAHQHAREVAVYTPTDALWAEQTGIALGCFQIKLTQGQAGEAHHLSFDTAANRFHGYLDTGSRWRCRLLVEAFVDQALDHAGVGQG
ncbi:hypothetical protein D3C84_782060 [compost metagenome]